MIEADMVIVDSNGVAFTVCSLLSSGTGQGDVYLVSDPNGAYYALKLYRQSSNPEECLKQLEQIERLRKRGNICPGMCVNPLSIVRADGRLGFIMEYIPDEFVHSSVLCLGVRDDNGQKCELPFHIKLNALYNICTLVSMINNAGLSILDLKFDNIRVNPSTGDIKLLDTDTLVYENETPQVLGTVGFMPPLTMRGKEAPNIYNDAFALGVILFMTLFGSHPLRGAAAERNIKGNIDEVLYAEHPVYIFHPEDSSNRPVPATRNEYNQQRTIDRMKRYPPYIKRAFERTFVDGLFDGKQRVSAEEWLGLLVQLHGDSYNCSHCGEEYFFHHDCKLCNVCGSVLKKPLFLYSERYVPLFYGESIYSDDLWQGDKYELFKVVSSKYDGRIGLQVLAIQEIELRLDHDVRTFEHDGVVPIFMDGEMICGTHRIRVSRDWQSQNAAEEKE